ncbi:MAG: hypothetical protein F6K42_02465 [Leptolyngbya sp. SIO1D8]|nr:hypothetical protein [Leptolyngbya sp. SIO1D8]
MIDFMAMRESARKDLDIVKGFLKQQQGSLLLSLRDIPLDKVSQRQDTAVRIEICQRSLAAISSRQLTPHLLNLVKKH